MAQISPRVIGKPQNVDVDPETPKVYLMTSTKPSVTSLRPANKTVAVYMKFVVP